jgi:hypothetical protein
VTFQSHRTGRGAGTRFPPRPVTCVIAKSRRSDQIEHVAPRSLGLPFLAPPASRPPGLFLASLGLNPAFRERAQYYVVVGVGERGAARMYGCAPLFILPPWFQVWPRLGCPGTRAEATSTRRGTQGSMPFPGTHRDLHTIHIGRVT